MSTNSHSGDANLLADYLNGDPYTNCAIRMGLAPEGSTKETVGALRDTMKVWLLSTLYGASSKSLHEAVQPGSARRADVPRTSQGLSAERSIAKSQTSAGHGDYRGCHEEVGFPCNRRS